MRYLILTFDLGNLIYFVIPSESQELIAKYKLKLAKIYGLLDDMNSSEKAEKLFQESIAIYSVICDRLDEKLLKAKQEFVKFYLKQDKLNVSELNFNFKEAKRFEFT